MGGLIAAGRKQVDFTNAHPPTKPIRIVAVGVSLSRSSGLRPPSRVGRSRSHVVTATAAAAAAVGRSRKNSWNRLGPGHAWVTTVFKQSCHAASHLA